MKYTVAQVVKMLHLSEQYIYKLIKQGKLKARKTKVAKSVYMIDEKELNKLRR